MDERLMKTIENLFYDLVSIRSDTNTTLEKDIEDYIYNWLSNMEYFKKNPYFFGLFKLNKDPLGRAVVWALVKGKGDKTVVFLHHHDVVDTSDYGKLSDYAYSPEELMDKLKDIELPGEIRADLESGEWIFGRGTADMKAGAAIQLALLKRYSEKKDFNGNILFVSVPDEESLSIGMREGVILLREAKRRFGLSYELLINSEPHLREDNDIGLIYEGSVGKIMPLIYVRGKKTHVGDVFKGFNPIILLSKLVERVELNPEFCDVVDREVSTPPSWVYLRDRKKSYDASLPEAIGGYFNILTLNTTPKEIIDKIKNICEQSFSDVLNLTNENYGEYLRKANGTKESLPWKVNVKTFSELYNEALRNAGDVFIKEYNKEIEKIKQDISTNTINMSEATFLIIEKTLQYINDKSPMVVLALSPPYYPHISNIDYTDLSNKIKNLGKEINKFSLENINEKYDKRNYFMGISDMSYAGLAENEDVFSYIETNMPLWGKVYHIPFKEMKNLSIPVINIGPWGKDLHKFTERVKRKDLLENTPNLIEFTIDYVLKEGQNNYS